MTAHVELRPGLPGEADALSALALRSKAHWGYSAGFLEACRRELTLAESQLPSVTAAVADDTIAGFSLLEGDGPDGELAMLFVDPPWIGRGLGDAPSGSVPGRNLPRLRFVL